MWLAPLQVKILPISDKYLNYCKEIQTKLRMHHIRVEIDDRAEKIGKKIRDTELARVPYMLIVGEKEMNENAVSLRIQGKGDQGIIAIDSLISGMLDMIKNRRG